MVIIAGVSNTNAHSLSAYIDVVSGGASLRFDSVTRTAASGGGLTRVVAENIAPGTASNIVLVITAPGTEYYFILPQLEEGAFCTSPIAKMQDGSDPLTAITRAGTVLPFPTAGKIRSNNQAYLLTCVPRSSYVNDSINQILFSLYQDSNNRFNIFSTGYDPSINITYIVGGATTSVASSLSRVSGTPIRIIVTKTAQHGIKMASQAYSSGWGNWTIVAEDASAIAKSNMVVPTNYLLGSTSGGGQFTGNISELRTLDIPLGIADPLAWAKKEWGLPA